MDISCAKGFANVMTLAFCHLYTYKISTAVIYVPVSICIVWYVSLSKECVPKITSASVSLLLHHNCNSRIYKQSSRKP